MEKIIVKDDEYIVEPFMTNYKSIEKDIIDLLWNLSSNTRTITKPLSDDLKLVVKYELLNPFYKKLVNKLFYIENRLITYDQYINEGY